jgi:hypothetical protein
MVFVNNPTTTGLAALASTPSTKVTVTTFVEQQPVSPNSTALTTNKMAEISIVITNVKTSLIVDAFNRAAAYAQNLAVNDINPQSLVNTMENSSYFAAARVNNPNGDVTIAVNKGETVPVCSITLTSAQIRLDHLDEYFTRTSNYIAGAVDDDLNPEI